MSNPALSARNRRHPEVGQTHIHEIVAVVALLTAVGNAPPASGARLPLLEAGALDGRRLVLPDSAAGSIALLGFGYKRESQDDLNSWLVPFRNEYPPARGFRAYEVPMMGTRIPGVLRGVINRAMRNAIPKDDRRWVAPFYGDIDSYSARLGVVGRSRVQVFLVDRAGIVRWHASGRADSARLAVLRLEVDKLGGKGE